MSIQIYRNKSELIRKLITKEDSVLDTGFWGQGVPADSKNWPHRILVETGADVYGVDIEFDESKLPQDKNRYFKQNAEGFNLEKKFSIIFAADLIEHLSNPGLFLKTCLRHLEPNGKIVITTPNCFNLFHMAGKLTNFEPMVNSDHVCYYNLPTIKTLLSKNNLKIRDFGFLYSLGVIYKESFKKKLLNFVYFILSKVTNKFLETLVIIAENNDTSLSINKNKSSNLNQWEENLPIPKYFRVVKYIISGGTAALVNIILLFVFTDFFGIWYLSSAVLAFVVAFIVSFVLQKLWTFEDGDMNGINKQLSLYLFIALFNLAINTAFLFFLVDIIGIYYLVGQVISGGTVALYSFFLYRHFIFNKNT